MELSNKPIKALCYFDDEKGRDVEILLPLIYFAEKYLNIDIENAFIFDIDKIRRRKPDLIIIANTIGSKLHHQISEYAFSNGVKVFALISEGNFRTNGTFNYWGYNTNKVYYQEYICHWSERTKEYLSNELPEIKSKMVLTGATGFDRYKIYKFESKESFLKRYQLGEYKKVITYAGWAFGKIHNPTGLMEVRNTHGKNAERRIKWMHEQQGLIENILEETVVNNPDILFVLKRHPNEIHPHLTQEDNNEMIKLSKYSNVLYLRNEEDVHTLINVSDIWTAFESTTTIEAWMMKDIPTIFINPEIEFVRDDNYKGTVIVSDAKSFKKKIDEFYQTRTVKEMNLPEKVKAREEIIKNVIGFADGYNHIRAGYYLAKVVNNIQPNINRKVKFNLLYFLRYVLMHLGDIFYVKSIFIKLPRFKKTLWIFERYKLRNIESLKQEYFVYLDKFYKKNNLSDKIKTEPFWKQILSN